MKRPETVELSPDEIIAAYLAAYAAAHPGWPAPVVTPAYPKADIDSYPGTFFVKVAVFNGPPGLALPVGALARETGKLQQMVAR